MADVTRKEYEQALREKARLEVQIEQLERVALDDPDIQELVRVRAWLNHEKDRVTGTPLNPIAPEGWPPGLDVHMELETEVFTRLAR